MKHLLLLTLLFCICFQGGAFAQVNATVTGTVADSTGALIPSVAVVATNVNTGVVINTLSNEAGNYVFASLQPGQYTLTAELPGFQTARYNNVQLSQGQQVRLNFALQVGNQTTSVQVVFDADTALATTSASIGDALPEVEVRSLPLATRNVLDLIASTAGVVGDSFAGLRVSQLNTTRDGIPTTDGRFYDSNGVYSAVFTSPDLVEEVQVSVSTVDAAAGRGVGQVKMQTRSGTNAYHGALFYTNNNSAYDSMGWFDNLVGASKSYENRNQFGGRVGGPIIKNKMFFFALIDEQRYLAKESVVSTVLTAPARAGIFRFLTANSVGGTSRRNGNAFSAIPSVDLNGNIVTQSNGQQLFMNQFNVFSDVNDPNRKKIDSVWVSSQYLPRMPLPNDYTVGDGLNTAGFRWLRPLNGSDDSTGTSSNANRNHLSTRFDYTINSNNKVSYSMTREKDWGVTGQTGLPSYPDGYYGEVQRLPDFYTASWTSTISPVLLNEVRWGYKRDSWIGWTPPFLGYDFHKGTQDQKFTDLAQKIRASFPTVDGQPFYIAAGLGLGVYATESVAAPRSGLSPLQQFSDTLSWTHGKHSFQTGVDVTYTSSAQYSVGSAVAINPRSTLGVGPIPVQTINAQRFPGLNGSDVTTAEQLLSNLAGTVSGYNHMYYVNNATDTEWSSYPQSITKLSDWHQNDWAAYWKDSWQANRNLTLNLGLRYDKYGVPWDSHGVAGGLANGQAGLFGISGKDFSAMWNPHATGGSLTQVQFIGKNSTRPNVKLFNDDWNNFGPSIGFSYNVTGLGRSTVVRGGYGVSYTGVPNFLTYTSQSSNVPGVALNLNANVSTYLDLSMVANPNSKILPIDIGGAKPLDTIPLTDRSQSLSAYADNKVIPYVQNFNLSVQRELAKNLTLEVGYIGTKSTKLRGAVQINEVNIFENGILDAFKVTAAGGDAPLFDQMLMGVNVSGVGTVNGTSITGSRALRAFATTKAFFANGNVGALADFLNSSNIRNGERGGLLRNPACTVCSENFIVANPQFAGVTLQGNTTNAIYHSLQTTLSKRLSNGFSGQLSYTWSKNLGDTLGSDSGGNMRDPRNRTLQHGLVSFNRTQGLRSNGTWELPFGPGRKFLSQAPSWVQRSVEGWQLSGILSWNSGTALTFTSPLTTMGSRSVSNTADLVGKLPDNIGKVTVRDGFVEYFPNMSVKTGPLPNFGTDPNGLATNFTNQIILDSSGNTLLQNPNAGTTGNLAYNLANVTGPSTLGLDMAMSKRFRVNETMSFTVRADAINALNKPQWGNPNTNINATTFGRITTASGARTFTLNGRIDF